MKTIAAYEAKSRFSEILREAAAGEVFVITRNGRRMAELRPCPPSTVSRRRGMMKKAFGPVPDDFNRALADFTEYEGDCSSTRALCCGFCAMTRNCPGTRGWPSRIPPTKQWVTTVSIWEIAMKAVLGKIKAPLGLEHGLEARLAEAGFTLLEVSYRHAAGVYGLPRVHTDPFDRLLISQCRAEKLVAVTNDAHWSNPEYGLRVLW